MSKRLQYDNFEEYKVGLKEVLTQVNKEIADNSDKIISYLFVAVTDEGGVISSGGGEEDSMSLCFNLLIRRAAKMGYGIQICEFEEGSGL